MKHIRLLIIFAVVIFTATVKAQNAGLVLQDESLLVVFDQGTGALIRLENRQTGWVIERRSELGISFRMHVPLEERRYNFVCGQKQKVKKAEKTSANEIRLQWGDLESENGGVLPIDLTAVITLKDGALTFNTSVDNRSELTVETIDYPYFGDFNPPSGNDRLHVRTMWYGNLESQEIYPNFGNSKGYWGDFVPTKTFDSFRSLFCLIQANGQGLYVETRDPTHPYLIEYTFEQYPGNVQSVNSLVPQQDKISGLPVHIDFRTCHFIFTPPGSTKKLVPIVLRTYDGAWHQGVDLYKEWRKTWFKPAYLPDWIKDVHSWLQLQINSPEQDYRVKYKELYQYGKECADHDVKAIQLVGWNLGGQDGGDPNQNTDPGLGTRDDLKKAIADIEKLGVRMVMFGKINWGDMTTDWYKNELYKYAATDPYGIPYIHGGYSYYTPTQLSGINNRRRGVMDFCAPAFQDVITKEFGKVLDLGASGWLFDENCHHGGVKYSFAADHGYTPPGYIYGADMPLAAKMREAADKVNRNFIFAGEGHQDWLMQYYPCSYFRINGGSTAVDRYVDPYAPLVVAVTGVDDREKLNLILMARYIISYEPYHFKGHVNDFPLTLEYGKKIDRLRRTYRDYLWDAEFKDTLGANVKANGAVRHSVFVAKNGKRAVVMVNMEESKSIDAELEIPHSGKLMTASPEDPSLRPFSRNTTIPPRSAVVVMEQ
ncbi:MAG: DUF6259 domain-containing protein [Tannerella sp.]|jgi:hypothetical protein|nr:DUF6259 domain-containing protein [Tannerella sp.]